MRIAIIGQQEFGKAALEAFLARGDEVAGVFCMPEKAGAKPDVLARGRAGPRPAGVPVHQPAQRRCRAGACASSNADIGVMAYVLQFAPQAFVNIPRHGTIQFHPSLLPRHRGPSSISWPIALGETRDRHHHLPAHRRAGRRPGDPAEVLPHRPGRNAGRAVFQQAVSDGRGGAAGSGRPGGARAGTRSGCRTNRRPATKAGTTRKSNT